MFESENARRRWYEVQSKLYKLYVHDLKNPISALSANLSFIDSTIDDEDLRGAVQDSLLAIEMLLRFADNLNVIAMLESGEQVEESDVHLTDFVLASVKRLEPFARSANIKLEVDATALPNTLVRLQHKYAAFTLDNLILSAVRHSPPSGMVGVGASLTNDGVRIEICDQGQPVDHDTKTMLFTREFQAEAKKNPGSRYGRGLGLYAVGLAAQTMGAQLRIDNDENEVRFGLEIPLSFD